MLPYSIMLRMWSKLLMPWVEQMQLDLFTLYSIQLSTYLLILGSKIVNTMVTKIINKPEKIFGHFNKSTTAQKNLKMNKKNFTIDLLNLHIQY